MMLTLNHCKRMAIAAALAGFVCIAGAATYNVSTIADLQTRINSAVPGDRIILADGTYTTSSYITVNEVGTLAQPIVIEAATLGGATIAGTHGFSLSSPAKYIHIQGFKFTHTVGRNAINSGATFCRFTRNIFECTGTTDAWYLQVSGNDAEVDHNEFRNKSSPGGMLDIRGSGTQLAERLWAHHNYFHDRTPGSGNGYETVGVGVSSYAASTGDALIEYNLFVRCSGEAEIISVKACGNTISNNTFFNCAGALTLRNGHFNTVDGNYFYQNGAAIPADVGGIRIIGEDHSVINNYFYNLKGDGAQSAISITEGDLGGGGTAVYLQVKRALVAFNTIKNCTRPFTIGTAYSTPYAVLPPQNCVIANNIVDGTGGNVFEIEDPAALTTMTWAGNIMYGMTINISPFPPSGITNINPRLVADVFGVYRPQTVSPISPAIDAAVGSYPSVTFDMDGQARPLDSAKDIGADEVSTGPKTMKQPLTAGDVGIYAGLYLPGDLNASGTVDLGDFAVLARDWGKTSGTYTGDISGLSGVKDGNVDLYDLIMLSEDWLQ
jgi:poly(beta-D-mannuronate) lyase